MEDIKIRLEKALKQIGWKLRHFGCEHYRPVDPKGNVSNFEFYDTGLTFKPSSDEINELCSINLKSKNSIRLLATGNSVDCVACGSKTNFVLFMNHDKKKGA